MLATSSDPRHSHDKWHPRGRATGTTAAVGHDAGASLGRPTLGQTSASVTHPPPMRPPSLANKHGTTFRTPDTGLAVAPDGKHAYE
jgi:hypothetical protein